VRALAAALLVVLVAAGPAFAIEPAGPLADPAQEARARGLFKELRCLVCQNQSIDESDAPLAADLRVLVRERITAGDSDSEVLTYLTDRYGAFVRLRPPVTASTIALWASPAIIAFIAIAAAIIYLRGRRTPTAEPSALTEDEERALKTLLAERRPEP